MSDEVVGVNHAETKHAVALDKQKQAQAEEIVKRNVIWSAGVGLLPVPLVEIVAITAVELKLINELAEHYGIPFRKDLAKESVIALLGSLGSVTIGKVLMASSLRFIPVVGTAIAATSVSLVASAVTYAIGTVFTMHFASGGTLLDFNVEKTRAFFRAEYQKVMNRKSEIEIATA